MKIKEITLLLEALAPPAYQESYDNAGLLTGSPTDDLTGILFTLDATEDIMDEAIAKGCNLVVAHHPIIFSGLKKINGKNYVERTVIKAIKNDIAIYAIHTNLDNVLNGVNAKISEIIGLKNLQILAPKKQQIKKLAVLVPPQHAENLLEALSNAGTGNIGNYSRCSFSVDGVGRFLPNEAANPVVGQRGSLEKITETRIEVIFPAYAERQVLTAMRQAHPYEEIAYQVFSLENENQQVGAGMVGELPEAMDEIDFLNHLKQSMQLNVIKHTKLRNKKVQKVAVCGGAGSFLLPHAKAAGADVFVSADYKYHEFFDAEQQLIIADIGHYESEQFTRNLLFDFVKKGVASDIKLLISSINTNPVFYF